MFSPYVTPHSPYISPAFVVEQLIKGSVAQYKAFRLLHSSIGKIFFKALSGNRYKAKLLKSVEASKQTWCKEGGGGERENQQARVFCLFGLSSFKTCRVFFSPSSDPAPTGPNRLPPYDGDASISLTLINNDHSHTHVY